MASIGGQKGGRKRTATTRFDDEGKKNDEQNFVELTSHSLKTRAKKPTTRIFKIKIPVM